MTKLWNLSIRCRSELSIWCEKLRNLDRWTCQCQCQRSDLSKMTGFREECPCPHALICQIWHLSDELSHFQSILTICSSRIVASLERNKSILPSLPPPSHTVVLGYLLKNPLFFLYSQKARIPGLRECVGVIIPNPCTLNKTFCRELNTLPVVHVAYLGIGWPAWVNTTKNKIKMIRLNKKMK